MKTFFYLFLILSILASSSCTLKRQKNKRRPSRSAQKPVSKQKKDFQLIDIFVPKQKRMALKCPTDKGKRGKRKGKIQYIEPKEVEQNGASLHRRTRAIHFDIIEIEEARLDIPAFKQFKNNHTDFTEDGEEQFKLIIQKIRNYLGPENTTGEGVTLKIIGSASQIPTSFDPSKPNNNVRKDGSSIPGQTNIENNRKLAQARALELAKKIQKVFTKIKVETPKLSEIKLGETRWDADAQRRLNDAHLRGDQAGKNAVFEPYQKEQYVKVESKESKKRTIKPNAINMYIATAKPRLHYVKDGDSIEVGRFIISEETYQLFEKKQLYFKTVEERISFLKENKLEIYLEERSTGERRWYLLKGKKEKHTFKIHEHKDFNKKRLYALYELGIVNDKDKKLLEEIITEEYFKKHKELRGHNITFEEVD